MVVFFSFLFHIYQPPVQIAPVVKQIVNESYRPIVEALKSHPEAKITLNINGTLTEQLHDFGYDDLIEGIIKFMRVDYLGPLNLGNPAEFTIIELAKKILELTNSKSKIKFLSLPQDDPKQRQPDITKAKRLLNWQPKISLDEGLKKTISWFRQKV